MTVLRWVFVDTVTSSSTTLPFNPNKMTSPFLDQVTATSPRSPIDGQVRVNRRKAPPKDFSFGGFIRSQAHHDLLLALSGHKSLMHVTDHLGRTFAIRFIKFDVEERKPTQAKPWKFEYTMRCLTYGEV